MWKDEKGQDLSANLFKVCLLHGACKPIVWVSNYGFRETRFKLCQSHPGLVILIFKLKHCCRLRWIWGQLKPQCKYFIYLLTMCFFNGFCGKLLPPAGNTWNKQQLMAQPGVPQIKTCVLVEYSWFSLSQIQNQPIKNHSCMKPFKPLQTWQD